MLNILGKGYIKASIWLKCKVEAIKENEYGVSGIIAAVVLVLIAILLGAIFWDKVKALLTDIWNRIMPEVDNIKKD